MIFCRGDLGVTAQGGGVGLHFGCSLVCLHLLCRVCNIVKLTLTMGGLHLMGRYLSDQSPMLFAIVWLFTVLWFW